MTRRTNAVAAARSFGHTVDFISDGLPYAKYIVTDGQSVAAPSPEPTKSGQHFGGWLDAGTAVTFPYTPTGDISLAAQFVTTRDGMVLTAANKLICTLPDAGGYEQKQFRKKNDGWCIAGYMYSTAWGTTFPVLVGLTSSAIVYTANGYDSNTEGNITYNGVTYYYSNRSVAVAGNHTSSASEVIELIRGEQYHTYRFAEDLVRYYSYET